MAVEMMLSSGEIVCAGARRQQIEHIINLHGIGVDDETAGLPCHMNGKCRLAAGRWASYQDGILDRLLTHRRNRSLMSASASLVATLIANPAKAALVPSLGIKASAAVNATGLYWLADRIACDIPLPTGLSAEDADAALRATLDGAPVDVVVQAQDRRRKKILIADMDSTMIQQECIDELAEEAGLRDHVAAITARAMNGEIAFEPALRERVALLKGLSLQVIDKVIATRITLTPGGPELVRTMRKHGAYTALVSGGFTSFTHRIAEMIGFNEDRANLLLDDGAQLTGVVAEPILGREAKVERLEAIADRLGLSTEDAIAVGDGANDLGMIQLAGTGVALHAKPAVAAQAKVRIDHGDLTALLYIQGYRKADFVE